MRSSFNRLRLIACHWPRLIEKNETCNGNDNLQSETNKLNLESAPTSKWAKTSAWATAAITPFVPRIVASKWRIKRLLFRQLPLKVEDPRLHLVHNHIVLRFTHPFNLFCRTSTKSTSKTSLTLQYSILRKRNEPVTPRIGLSRCSSSYKASRQVSHKVNFLRRISVHARIARKSLQIQEKNLVWRSRSVQRLLQPTRLLRSVVGWRSRCTLLLLQTRFFSCLARCGPWLRWIQCDFFLKDCWPIRDQEARRCHNGIQKRCCNQTGVGKYQLGSFQVVGFYAREAEALSITCEEDIMVDANLFFRGEMERSNKT